MAAWNKIIICCCAERRRIVQDNIRCLCAAANAAGIPVELRADCCRDAAEHPDALRSMAEAGATLVGGCLERAMKAIFAAAGAALPTALLDLRSAPLTPEKLSELGLAPGRDSAEIALPVAGPGWSAWFPVIDRKRCINCGKCLDFCLFGVYDFDRNRQVRVVKPANCKNNCPACARACPREAIIFPKYPEPPINGGENVENVLALHGAADNADLYKMLAERRKLARKLFRDNKDAEA